MNINMFYMIIKKCKLDMEKCNKKCLPLLNMKIQQLNINALPMSIPPLFYFPLMSCHPKSGRTEKDFSFINWHKLDFRSSLAGHFPQSYISSNRIESHGIPRSLWLLRNGDLQLKLVRAWPTAAA